MQRSWRQHTRRHPLFWAALATVLTVAAANVSTPLAAATALACASLGLSLGSWRLSLAWLLCASLALATFLHRNHQRQENTRLLLAQTHPATHSGTTLEDATPFGRGWSTKVKLSTPPAAGTTVRWLGDGPPPVAGAIVTAPGTFSPPPRPRNPGEFDHAAWLERSGVAADFQAAPRLGSITTPTLAAAGAHIRQAFRNAITDGLAPDSPATQTIRAIVIGEHPPDADELIAAFRHSGTLHIFSVSGMHVAMVASIAWAVLRALRIPRRAAIGVLIAVVFGYSWLTGNSPPAVRSAWMAAVFFSAFLARRRPDLLNTLGLVLLAALLWDGNLLFQPGVQLSYGVVAAIAIGTQWAAKRVAWLAAPEPYLPSDLRTRWQKRWLDFRQRCAQSIAVSIAAFIGSTPLTIFHFGLITPISILATLALIPTVFVLLSAALLSAAIHPFTPTLSQHLNQANRLAAQTCISTAATLAAVPGSHFNLRHFREPSLIVYNLPQGSGAAVLSESHAGAVFLDCGDRNAFRSLITPSLRNLGVFPDAAILSHPDGRHLGGGPQVWQAFPIRQALLPVARSRSPNLQAWLREAPIAGIQTAIATPDTTLPLPANAQLEVLITPNQNNPGIQADDRVAVALLHWRGWRILLTSDAGLATETKLLASTRNLAADVIIAGRHTSSPSLTDPFIERVNPAAIITTNTPFPQNEQLPPQQAAWWQQRGIAVFDQALTGAVTLTPAPNNALTLTGFLSGKTTLTRPSNP